MSTPLISKSSSRAPSPMPRTARLPPASVSRERICFATIAAFTRSGPSITSVARRMRSVTAAAAERAIKGS
jgi:hypothetical protein